MNCPNCHQELAEDAAICRHCNHVLHAPKRPTGLTVIGVLSIIGGVFGLFGFFTLNEYNSILLGQLVDPGIAKTVALISGAIAIYCGIGFIKQQKTARTIYLGYSVYSIISTLLIFLNSEKIINSIAASVGANPYTRYGEAALTGVKIGLIGGSVFSLVLVLIVMIYVLNKKDYFVY